MIAKKENCATFIFYILFIERIIPESRNMIKVRDINSVKIDHHILCRRYYYINMTKMYSMPYVPSGQNKDSICVKISLLLCFEYVFSPAFAGFFVILRFWQM